MSLEQELVFELMDKGNDREDVFEIVEHMGDPELSKCAPVNLDQKKIENAIKKYELQKDYINYKKNKSNIKKKAKERLNKLISKKVKELEKEPEVLSIKILKTRSFNLPWKDDSWAPHCYVCGKKPINQIFAEIKYIENSSQGQYLKRVRDEHLAYFCPRCGTIDADNLI